MQQSLTANTAARRLQEVPTEEDCGSPVIQWGDGVCDTRLNTEACEYDGGAYVDDMRSFCHWLSLLKLKRCTIN